MSHPTYSCGCTDVNRAGPPLTGRTVVKCQCVSGHGTGIHRLVLMALMVDKEIIKQKHKLGH